MTFASPAWLLLLLLGGVIAFLHSRPRRDIEVGSLFLWRQLHLTVPPKATQKLPVPNVLLFLQLLALLLITLALARPMRSGSEPPVDHWIVALDASASMEAAAEGTSAFDEARGYLTARLESAGRLPARVTIVTVAASPAVEVARLGRRESLIDAAEALRPAHTGADWTQVPATLRGLTLAGERTRVTVLTDGPGRGAAEVLEAVAVDDSAIDIELFTFGESATNLALVAAEPILLDPATGLWRIAGEVRRYGDVGADGDEPVTVRVLFEPATGEAGATPAAASPERASVAGAGEWTTLDVTLGPAGVAGFDQTIALPGAGVLEIRLPDDALANDNSLHFVLRDAPRSARVLYVGAGDPDLDLALRAIPGVSVTRSGTLPATAEDYDLVLLDGVSGAGQTGTNTIWLGAPPDGGQPAALADPTPSGWRANHPLSRSVDWGSLGIRAALELALLPGAVAVVEAPGGHPLVQARTTAAGREVVLAFRIQDTDWPDQLGFPAFVSNLLVSAVPDLGRAVEPHCRAGTACPLGPRQLGAGWSLISPAGTEVPLPGAIAADLESTFTPRQSGVYRLVSESAERAIAVNAADAAEADLVAADAAEAAGATADLTGASAWPPVQRWLLALGVLALVAEAWLAGQRGERSFRLHGLRTGNPLALRRRAVLGLRVAALTLLVLAVLDPRTPIPTREANAVLVIDEAAAAAPETRDAADTFLADAVGAAGGNRRLGTVRVGAAGQVTSDVGSTSTGGTPSEPAAGAASAGPQDSSAGPPAADLEASLRLAAALLPPAITGRIAVVGDGVETRGSVAAILPELLARGIPVDVVLPPETAAQDVSVEAISLPAAVHPNEAVPLRAVIHASDATTATLSLLRDGEVRGERAVELQPGRNRIDFEISEEATGDFLYEVELALSGGGDTRPGNDRNGIVVEVREPPRIAIVTPQPSWGRSFADALAVQGLNAEVLPPSRIPSAGSDAELSLADFDAVALMNVPATDLPDERASELEAWVRGGGGLILMGGENTFGPGGYFDSPLEIVSPLSAKIPQELPNLAIIFVLDRSGSMNEILGQGTRLDLAKVATLEAIELLDPETEVGVIAFDLNAYSVVPLQPAGNREAIREQIERLETGGGTWIYTGLALAFVELSKVDPEFRRHIVLMSDGRSQPSNYSGLMNLVTDAGMTVSTAAIGLGADVLLMEDLARRGSGAAHVTNDFTELPSILAREASRFSSSAIREEPVAPTRVGDTAEAEQAFGGGPDNLGGFVRTTVKPGAQVHIEAAADTPLLASWRYGLGRVVAFASQGAGAWTTEWMESPEYSTWWSQTVRWAAASARAGLNVTVNRDRDYGRIVAEMVGGEIGDVGELALQATVRAPDGSVLSGFEPAERSPGVYEMGFIADRPGTYAVTVESSDPAANDIEPVGGTLYVGYPGREATDPNVGLLRALAAATGGRVLTSGEALFDTGTPVRWLGRSIWTAWALVALGVFLFELFGRYTGVLKRLDAS